MNAAISWPRLVPGGVELNGATRFYPRVDCDADYNRAAAAWINGVLVTLQQESVVAASA